MFRKRAAPIIGAALFLCAAGKPPCGTLVLPTGIGQQNPGAVTSLNPLIVNDIPSQEARMMLYRPLIWLGADNRVDHADSLADRVTPNADNTVFRVALKPWLWSDGQAITADDMVFSWSLSRALKQGFAYGGGVLDRVTDVRAVDVSDVDFVLSKPTNPDWFELNGLGSLYPLPKHAWGTPDKDTLWQHQNDPAFFNVVDGAFRLQDFRLDRYAAFVPNPRYGGHRATIPRVVLAFMEGADALQAVQSGELDMAQVPPALWEKAKRTPGFHFPVLPDASGFEALIFNMRNERVAFFRDVRVRQALTDAADQAKMIKLVFQNLSHEARTPASSNDEPSSLPVRYCPKLAARLLDEAGWHVGEDGLRRKDGKMMSFTVMLRADQADSVQEMQILQRNLRDVGVEMKLRLTTGQTLLDTTQHDALGWDAVFDGLTVAGVPDALGYFGSDGDYNVGGYKDATMDRLGKDVQDLPGAASIAAFNAYAAAQQPWNFLPQRRNPLMVADGVEGADTFSTPQGFWAPEYLSLDGNRACPHA